MIKHIWSVICRESVINQENNAMSLMNIFEGLQVGVKRDTPKNLEIDIPVQYEIVTLLKKDKKNIDERVELKITLIDPNGVIISKPITVPIVIEKGKLNHRHRLKNFGFKVTIPGEYKFIVEMKQTDNNNYEIVSTIPLEVTVMRQG